MSTSSKTTKRPDGVLCASQTHEWSAEGIAPQLPNAELQALPYTSDALEPLRETVSKGETLVQLVRDMPAAARTVLEPQSIVSMAVVPIITRDAWNGFLGFDDCIHERCWSEVEIDALNAGSAILGAAMQRTADEAHLRHKEEQPRQAQKMEAIGNLAGGIAHDFNNVLQIIWLWAETLHAKLPADSRMRRDARTIGDAVLRARSLPNQLLAFARRQVVQTRLLSLHETVGETVALMCRVIGEDVEIDVRRSSEPALVRVDPVQLQQAVMNLMLNARDAMPRGGAIRILVDVAHVASEQVTRHARIPAGNFAVVTIQDDGVGMDEATLDRVFEPFFTTKARGHGIGLATVYGIVEQNQGHITVDSELGQGSRFSIYLPLAHEEEDPDTRRAPVESMPCGCENVLLVEDEESLRNALREHLCQLGYKVTVAPDGRSACEQFERLGQDVDLLLTDVVLPRMDGVSLAQRLREHHAGVKVLFMSGHAFDVLERRGIDSSDVTVLRKPFSASELARHVRAVLDAS